MKVRNLDEDLKQRASCVKHLPVTVDKTADFLLPTKRF